MNENKDQISELKAENKKLLDELNEIKKSFNLCSESEKINKIIFEISKTVHKAKTVKDFAEQIHLNLKNHITADNFYVALYNKKSEKYTLPYFVDQSEDYDGQPVSLKGSLTDYVRRTGKPLFADDAVHQDLYVKKEVDFVGPYSSQWLGVPLTVDDEIIGVVAIQDYSEHFSYSQKDLEILDFIAGNISFLVYKKIQDEKIKNAYNSLEQKVVDRTIQLENLNRKLEIDIKKREEAEKIQNALYRISNSVNNSGELDDLYKVIHNIVKSLMPADNFFISLVNESKELLFFPYYADEFDDPPSPLPFELNTLTGHIIKKGESIILNNDSYLDYISKNELAVKGTIPQTWIGVPLIMKNDCLGAMVVQDYQSTSRYSEKDKDILNFVSNQVAITISQKKDEMQISKILNELYHQRWELQVAKEQLENSNRDLTESESKLKRLINDRDKFFSIIAHDLKSPLQSLLGTVDYLKTEYQTIESEECEIMVNSIHNSTKHLYSLIENLLKWSLIQMNKIELNEENIELQLLTDKILNQLSQQLKNKNVKLSIKSEENLVIRTDSDSLEIIIRNLISNAIKFSYQDSEIKVNCYKKESSVFVSVQDFGIGISKEAQEKIISKSESVTTPGTKNEKGTGLGLLLCFELSHKLSGKLHLESELGKGTKFILQLPKKNILNT